MDELIVTLNALSENCNKARYCYKCGAKFSPPRHQKKLLLCEKCALLPKDDLGDYVSFHDGAVVAK